MPKLKTKKSVIKKIRVTKNDKVLRRKTKQNHHTAKARQDNRTQAVGHQLFPLIFK